MKITYQPMMKMPQRRAHRSLGGVKTTIDRSVRMLQDELRRLNATSVLLEGGWKTTYRFTAAGWPTTMPSEHQDVRVTVESKITGTIVLMCNGWSHAGYNLWNIAKTLENLRAIDRYGCVDRGQQWSGFKALPAGGAIIASEFSSVEAAARFILETAGYVDHDIPLHEILHGASGEDECTYYFRKAAEVAHPDRSTGSHSLMAKLNAARKMVMDELGRKAGAA